MATENKEPGTGAVCPALKDFTTDNEHDWTEEYGIQFCVWCGVPRYEEAIVHIHRWAMTGQGRKYLVCMEGNCGAHWKSDTEPEPPYYEENS